MNFRSDGGGRLSIQTSRGGPLVPPHKIHKVVRLISAKMPPQMADKSPFTTLTQTGGGVSISFGVQAYRRLFIALLLLSPSAMNV